MFLYVSKSGIKLSLSLQESCVCVEWAMDDHEKLKTRVFYSFFYKKDVSVPHHLCHLMAY